MADKSKKPARVPFKKPFAAELQGQAPVAGKPVTATEKPRKTSDVAVRKTSDVAAQAPRKASDVQQPAAASEPPAPAKKDKKAAASAQPVPAAKAPEEKKVAKAPKEAKTAKPAPVPETPVEEEEVVEVKVNALGQHVKKIKGPKPRGLTKFKPIVDDDQE